MVLLVGTDLTIVRPSMYVLIPVPSIEYFHIQKLQRSTSGISGTNSLRNSYHAPRFTEFIGVPLMDLGSCPGNREHSPLHGCQQLCWVVDTLV